MIGIDGANPVTPVELTREQFSQLAYMAAAELGWKCIEENDRRLTFLTANGSEKIFVSTDETQTQIVSEAAQLKIFGHNRNKKNVQQLQNKLNELKTTANASELFVSYEKRMEEKEAYLNDLNLRALNNELTAEERMALGIGGLNVTKIIIGLNVLVFIIMLLSGVSAISPTTGEILTWGGNFKTYTANGEWWRLLTSVFLHVGIIHLVFNMYALYYIGRQLEPLLGSTVFALMYLCTGIFSSVSSIWWSADRVSAGASGAIFGMYGVFIALLTVNYLEKETRKQFLSSMGIFVGYNLLFGMKEGIDNAAHIGGLISGLLLGYGFYYFQIKRKYNRLAFITLTAVLLLVSTLGVFASFNSDEDKFNAAVIEFSEHEEEAIQVLRKFDDTRVGEAEYQLRTKAMPALLACKKAIDKTAGLTLSAEYIFRRSLLQEYIGLRISQTQFLIKSEKEETHMYDAEIKQLDNRINDIIERLQKK